MPSITSKAKDVKKEYKELLRPKGMKGILSLFRSPKHRCLHCSLLNCQHLREIINAAAVSRQQSKPYPQLPSFTFLISDIFDFLRPLTKGAFGQLFLVQHKPSRKLMVAKVLSLAEAFVMDSCGEALQSYIHERQVMLRCKHPNIIRLYYSFRSEYFMYQMMEYADGGDLSTWLEGSFDAQTIQVILAQMVAALHALHSKGIIHGDLKLENVLVSQEQGQVKLADFGLSEFAHSASRFKASKGTPDYMAPEQLRGGKSEASDCWSLGVCAWELATQLPPFYAHDPQVILQSIAQANWARDLQARAPESKEFQHLLQGLLEPDPSRRLTVNGVNWKHLQLTIQPAVDPFERRNERFTTFKPYNLKVLSTERVIGAEEHAREDNRNEMFPNAELYHAAAELFPLCNLYILE